MTPTAHERAVLMFAKYPVAGSVKRRLTPALSPQQAAEVHAACAHATWTRLAAVSAARVLVHSPDHCPDKWDEVVGSVADETLWPQGVGDLGQRLARATQRAFSSGFRIVVAVGCDSPMVPSKRITEAFEVLGRADAVLGPTDDGGYYLVGLANPAGVALFESIDWGTQRVADQTRRRARDVGLYLAELPREYDIDHPADLDRAVTDLKRCYGDPVARELVRRLLTLRRDSANGTDESDDARGDAIARRLGVAAW